MTVFSPLLLVQHQRYSLASLLIGQWVGGYHDVETLLLPDPALISNGKEASVAFSLLQDGV